MTRKETLSAAQAGRSAELTGAEESGSRARKEEVAEAADEVELLSGSPQSVDGISEASLRPRSLDGFVGQTELKSHLEVMLGAACQRQEPVDHLLLAGPPGLGKTTMAHIVANELKVECQVTSGPALERTGDLAAMLTKLSEGAVLFIDEIHRLPRPVEEVLYPAMEDFRIDIVLGKGPAARSISLELAPFTLVGATTRTGLITGPLRDRFGLVARFDLYNHEDLTQIVKRTAGILGVPVTANGATEIARRARGTPRIANRLLRQVRDFAEMHREGYINAQVAADGLAFFSVDDLGLDRPSRAVLEALCAKFRGGPVGRSTLAIAVSEPVETLEDVYEPFLIQQGLLIRTPRGRVATKASWVHLGLEPPADVSNQHPELFR